MNMTVGTGAVTSREASLAVARLIPQIIRGIHMDFFVNRRVTQTQLLVLAAVRAYGRCTMGTLAKSLHVRMPSATGIVDRLVEGGYLDRVHGSEDRRQVAVELTRKGERFVRAFEGVIQQRWEEALRTLNQRELQAFHHVVTKLGDRLQPSR